MTFKEYLEDINLSPREFHLITRISVTTLYKLYNGEKITHKSIARAIIDRARARLKMEDICK